MGLFDTVRCHYPLPNHQELEFQTKTLASVVDGDHWLGGRMEEYEIAQDGRLRHHVHERVWSEDPEALFGGYLRSVRDWWEDVPSATRRIVAALQAIQPGKGLDESFAHLVNEGTGKTFEPDHNARWLAEARPIVEAFFHARYFLEMAVRYAQRLSVPPRVNVPPVAEAEDPLVGGHDVDDEVPVTPATDHAVLGILGQPHLAQAFRQRGVLGVGADLSNGVHVARGADSAGVRIGDEQASGTAADEHDFVEQGPQHPHGSFEHLPVRVVHHQGLGFVCEVPAPQAFAHAPALP
jgi:hypothetical protein